MKHTIVKIIGIFSVLIGIMVMIGWFLDITVLTSILPQWIRMKMITALCFVFSGFIVLIMSRHQGKLRDVSKILLTMFAMLNIFVMGTLFLGSVFGFQTGMENFNFVDVHEVKTPIFQGRPSVATMVCFLLIALAGVIDAYVDRSGKIINYIGWIVFLIGSIGVIGYIVNNPYLYYEIPSVSNAIAIHTTALFCLLGLGILLLNHNTKNT